eukprot:TRINITY_DN3933_c0_g1_i10.p2 TRINITY_DN3933_c0_g1~~TRINITY_DN3933_c0_g1_i10.p2  ORF type:complete len:353 (+),score=102.73 TRINITY_DN3933_c0_g1_i10:2659-3717(+)
MVLLQKRSSDQISLDTTTASTTIAPSSVVDQQSALSLQPISPDGPLDAMKEIVANSAAIQPPTASPIVIGTGNHDYMFLLAQQQAANQSFQLQPMVKRQKTTTSITSANAVAAAAPLPHAASSSSVNGLGLMNGNNINNRTDFAGEGISFMISPSMGSVLQRQQQPPQLLHVGHQPQFTLFQPTNAMQTEGVEGDFGRQHQGSGAVVACAAIHPPPTIGFDEEFLRMKDLVQQMKESFEENAETLVNIDQTIADILSLCGDEGTDESVFEDGGGTVTMKTTPRIGGVVDVAAIEGKKRRKRKEKLEPTVCKICNRTFTTRRGYNRHKAIHPKSVRAAKGALSDDDDMMDLAA